MEFAVNKDNYASIVTKSMLLSKIYIEIHTII